MSEQTCEERVNDSFIRTMKRLNNLWDSLQRGEEYCEEESTNIYEYGLSFDYVEEDTFDDQEEGYWRWQLSWGGPSSEFRFYNETNKSSELYKIEYWFMDWFDGANIELSGKDFSFLCEIFCFLRGI